VTVLLIADDEPDVLFVLERIFTRAGFTVLTATDGASALQTVRTQRPDVVLTDMNMPGLTGAELCRAVRDDPRLSGTPVAIISGGLISTDPAVTGAHPCTVILKPFEHEALILLIRRLADGGPHGHRDATVPCLQATTTT
jgi:CheY-like chemotaxis protein